MTTLSCLMSGLPVFGEEELREGRAVSADITGEGWGEPGRPVVPLAPPGEAGRRLARIAGAFHFTLFEYWKTDFAGHARDMAGSVAVLERLDGMLEGVMEEVDAGRTLLVLTSDHGNIEDLSVKTHTRNPVPLVVCGRRHRAAAQHVLAHARPGLLHVVPMIMEILAGG
jgi:hypothetical protein